MAKRYGIFPVSRRCGIGPELRDVHDQLGEFIQLAKEAAKGDAGTPTTKDAKAIIALEDCFDSIAKLLCDD